VYPGSMGNGPIALRMQLGAQLRRLRKDSNVTREAAGWEIRASESKISRMELGRVPFKQRDVADLLELYGVAEADRAALLDLAERASGPGWWQQYADVVPPWFLSYLGLEEAATLIRTYEIHLVPGLLQTADYAQAVIASHYASAPAADIDRRIDLRRKRQQTLVRPNPPQLWAVLDEAVLRRQIGGSDVMRGQIEALIEASERPNIRIQVVPFDVGTHSASGCPFTILRFADVELPDVVYVEQLTGAVYLDKPGDVEDYAATMERACLGAEPPGRTAALLRESLAETVGVG
jgi:hypothetical protein